MRESCSRIWRRHQKTEVRKRRGGGNTHGIGLIGFFDPRQCVGAAAAEAHVPLQQLAMALGRIDVDKPDFVHEGARAAVADVDGVHQAQARQLSIAITIISCRSAAASPARGSRRRSALRSRDGRPARTPSHRAPGDSGAAGAGVAGVSKISRAAARASGHRRLRRAERG
ncbi:MAG: hypothetical protein WDW38_006449 [Sanguina aurantia]